MPLAVAACGASSETEEATAHAFVEWAEAMHAQSSLAAVIHEAARTSPSPDVLMAHTTEGIAAALGSCVEIVHVDEDFDRATFEFTECSGPNGLAGVSGKLSVASELQIIGNEPLTVMDIASADGPLRANGATMSVVLTIVIFSDRQSFHLDTHTSGTSKGGLGFDMSLDHSWYTPDGDCRPEHVPCSRGFFVDYESCLLLDGDERTMMLNGKRYEGFKGVYRRCPGRCPGDCHGYSCSVFSDVPHVTVIFDGKAVTGGTAEIELDCVP